MELIALFGLLALSLAVNIGLYDRCRRLKQALLAARKAPAPTLEAEELLHDLTRGAAVVKIEVIDAKNLLLRSPRG